MVCYKMSCRVGCTLCQLWQRFHLKLRRDELVVKVKIIGSFLSIALIHLKREIIKNKGLHVDDI